MNENNITPENIPTPPAPAPASAPIEGKEEVKSEAKPEGALGKIKDIIKPIVAPDKEPDVEPEKAPVEVEKPKGPVSLKVGGACSYCGKPMKVLISFCDEDCKQAFINKLK